MVAGVAGKAEKKLIERALEASGWNKKAPAPKLPSEVIAKTAEKYREALTRLTGGDAAAIKELLPRTVSVIDTGVRKGVFHRNTAARVKSRLTTQANTVLRSEQK